jgi:hypothetical protein
MIAGSSSGAVFFCFKSNCPEVLLPFGKEMVKELYPEFECPESEYAGDFDITLKITKEGWPKIEKVKRDMDEDAKVQLRAENEKRKEEILAKATSIADKVSQFKRDYIGAPIRKCM